MSLQADLNSPGGTHRDSRFWWNIIKCFGGLLVFVIGANWWVNNNIHDAKTKYDELKAGQENLTARVNELPLRFAAEIDLREANRRYSEAEKGKNTALDDLKIEREKRLVAEKECDKYQKLAAQAQSQLADSKIEASRIEGDIWILKEQFEPKAGEKVHKRSLLDKVVKAFIVSDPPAPREETPKSFCVSLAGLAQKMKTFQLKLDLNRSMLALSPTNSAGLTHSQPADESGKAGKPSLQPPSSGAVPNGRLLPARDKSLGL